MPDFKNQMTKNNYNNFVEYNREGIVILEYENNSSGYYY